MTFARKSLLITAALFMAAFTVNTAMAAAGETALGKCYNRVIASCNSTSNHPVSCAENGMDNCDEVYGNHTNGGIKLNFVAPARPTQIGMLLPAVQAAREAAR